MRRFALLLLAAFLLSGCAVLTKQELKPVPKTLTHGRLVYLANRACERAVLRLKRHRPARGYLPAIAYLQHVFLPENDRLLFELRALTPPPSDAVAYRRLLATFNYEDLVVHHFFQAADEVQRQRTKSLLHRLKRVDRRLNSRAAQLGLKTCAKG